MEHTENHCLACFRMLDRLYFVFTVIAFVAPTIMGAVLGMVLK